MDERMLLWRMKGAGRWMEGLESVTPLGAR